MKGEITHIQPAFEGAGPTQWEIKAPPHVMMRLKKIFAKVDPQRSGAVLMSDTIENARELSWVMWRYDFEISDDDADYLDLRTREAVEREENVEAILQGGTRSDEWLEPAAHVDDYQYQAADLALATGGVLLADDLALGKTFSALLTLRNPDALPALVVCPANLDKQWLDQLNELLPWLRGHIIRTTEPYDPAKKRQMKGHDPDVLIITYSKLWGWADLLAGTVKTVFYDECQELRRPEARKTKAAGQVADAAMIRMGLSATPVFNYGIEIHHLLDVINPGCLGTEEEFVREWSGKWRQLGHYLQESGLMLRRTWADVGRVRPEEAVKIPHVLPEVDSDVIEDAESDAAQLAEVILHSSSQKEVFAAEGEMDNIIRQATGVAKAPYVADFIRMLLDSEDKVVVFAWHHAVYNILEERLAEFNPVRYMGKQSAAGKRRSKEAFLEDDEARILMMSLRSGAGLDGLQEGSHVCVFGELDWSPAMHDQCIGRLVRPGQKHQTLAYYLLSEEGSDPQLTEVLNVKRMESAPIRDPDAELFEPANDPSGRVKRLAQSVIDRQSEKTAA